MTTTQKLNILLKKLSCILALFLFSTESYSSAMGNLKGNGMMSTSGNSINKLAHILLSKNNEINFIPLTIQAHLPNPFVLLSVEKKYLPITNSFIPMLKLLDFKSSWLLSFLGIALSYLIGIWMISRSQRIRDLESCRTKISRNLHDEVGGTLTYISMQSEILKSEVPQEHKVALESIIQTSRLAMNNMRDVIWSMDTQYHQLGNLYDKFAEMIQKAMEYSPIHFHLNLEPGIREMDLTQEQKQEIFYIVKEAIQNIVKHSKGDQALIQVKRKNNHQLEFVISNNGEVQNLPSSTGSGIHNMVLRSQNIGAKFYIRELNGFEITLIVELKENILQKINKWLNKKLN